MIITVVMIKMVKTVKMMSMVHAMKCKFVAKLNNKKWAVVLGKVV